MHIGRLDYICMQQLRVYHEDTRLNLQVCIHNLMHIRIAIRILVYVQVLKV